MPLLIKTATIRDHQAAHAVQVDTIGPEGYTYADNILCGGTLNFVAELDGRVIGYLSTLMRVSNAEGRWFWQRVSPYIGFMGILKDEQNKGYGKELLKEALHIIARATNDPIVYLEHREENEGAKHVFEAAGFTTMTTEEVQNVARMEPHGPTMMLNLNNYRNQQ